MAIAAGIGALTVDPPTVEAAGIGALTVDPRPAEALTPGATAACNRGKNLSFETPRPLYSGARSAVDNWATTHTSGKTTVNSNTPAGDGNQFVIAYGDERLSQEFDTLSGDVIGWTVQASARQGTIRFGPPNGQPEYEGEVPAGEGLSWLSTSRFHSVTHTGSTTVLSLQPAHDGTSFDGIKLDLDCGVSISAEFGGFTDEDDSGHTNAGDTAAVTYVVRNTAAAVEDAASPANNRGAASLTNVAVTHPDDTEAPCPPDKKALLKPADANSADDEMTCTATYKLTQEDINAGAVTATATVTGDDAKAAKARDDATDPTTVSPTVRRSPRLLRKARRRKPPTR